LWAGEAVDLVDAIEPANLIVASMVDEAAVWLSAGSRYLT
jgi:hypothetical protein